MKELKELLTFGSLNGELAKMQTRFSNLQGANYKPSTHNQGTSRQINTATNLWEVFRLFAGHTQNGRTATILELDKGYAVELKDSNADSVTIVMALQNQKTKELYFKGSVIDSSGVVTDYDTTKRKGTAILLSLMPYFVKCKEFSDIWITESFQTLIGLEDTSTDWKFGKNLEDFALHMQTLSDNVYQRLTYPANSEVGIVGTLVNDKYSTTNLPLAKLADVKKWSVRSLLLGNPQYFTAPAMVNKNSAQGMEGKYALTEDRIFTDEQKVRIPQIQSWITLPPYVEEICRRFQYTSKFPNPMRTAMLIGDAGSGKTEGARLIASLLGLPHGIHTCHEGTEIFDFIGQIFPANPNEQGKTFDEVRKEMGLPTTEEIMFMPADCYEAIMGEPCKNPNNVDPSQLMSKMITLVIEKAKELCENSKDFTYVEGGLIKAIRNGECFEVQEIGCVKRAGVVVGINALLETGDNAYITLPTGETIKKHKDCCIIFTSNRGYEGTQNLNQSVLSRMAMVKRIDTPAKDELVNRVRNRIQFPLKHIDKLDLMANMIKDIEEYCSVHEITDGVCGYRELENWAMAVMCEAEIRGEDINMELIGECGIDTLINKTSQTDEYINDILTVYNKSFPTTE